MNATDELVRELTERTDRALPDMSLDADAVLAGGRRYRRQRAVVRSVLGVAGAAAIALGGLQVSGVLRGDDAIEVARLVTVGDFQVVAATEVAPLQVGGSTVYDTGVAVDPADPEGRRWVLEHTLINQTELAEGVAVEDIVSDYVTVRDYDPRTGALGESGIATHGTPMDPEDFAGGGMEVEGTLIGLTMSDPAYAPQVYLTGGSVDVPAELSRVTLPTFAVPGVDGQVAFVRISGAAQWPYVHLYAATNVGMVLNP